MDKARQVHQVRLVVVAWVANKVPPFHPATPKVAVGLGSPSRPKLIPMRPRPLSRLFLSLPARMALIPNEENLRTLSFLLGKTLESDATNRKRGAIPSSWSLELT